MRALVMDDEAEFARRGEVVHVVGFVNGIAGDVAMVIADKAGYVYRDTSRHYAILDDSIDARERETAVYDRSVDTIRKARPRKARAVR